MTKFLFKSTAGPLNATNKTRENSNLVKILTEQNVWPHFSNSDTTLSKNETGDYRADYKGYTTSKVGMNESFKVEKTRKCV